MPCTWSYEITAHQQFQNATVTVGTATLTLVPKTPRVRLLKVTGEVSFECRDIGQCKPRIFDLSYLEPPQIDVADLTNLYGFDSASQAIASKLGVSITQPTLAANSEIKPLLMGDGSCLNIHILADVNVTSGSATYDPPDIPIPGVNVQIPTPPITLTWGPSYSDKLGAEYILCCCRWDEALEQFDLELDREPEPNPWEQDEEIEACKLDCEFTFKYVRRQNSSATATWEVKATEGECAYKRVMVVTPDGTRTAKRKPGSPKAEKARQPAGP